MARFKTEENTLITLIGAEIIFGEKDWQRFALINGFHPSLVTQNQKTPVVIRAFLIGIQ
jgi:hypothetical protein